ncbi:Eco57I restriction-modification methylase domain-containing protein [Halorussus pelagicus]|uniref:Eco57I restriction-modification methylase domain-containing protein n=1 Tax=Halorussus pelagicus TaxID=2505977 RepID=UPI000FFBBDC1|nr:TaqI-like C-terminal specificity domain-containing protein [Halorussus pelagicus]
MQTTLDYRTNRDLFSNYYLDNHLPETDHWTGVEESDVRAAYEEIRDRYRREADLAPDYNERQLRENLLDPVFETLGLTTAVEEPVSGERLRPDYTLFGDERAREDAFERRSEGRSFHDAALAVADAKRWGRSLDGGTDRDFTNPSYQIHVYLDATGLNRGILTNGRKWRLYYGPTSHRLDSYYEIDLPTLLETGDVEAFKYFYLFFRREAFLGEGRARGANALAEDRPFVERVHRESNIFAEELSEDLRENVYDALALLAQGFVADASDGGTDEGDTGVGDIMDGDPDDALDLDLDVVYEASLTYLYRLIFVLYAESDGRDLLDTDNEVYRTRYSLNALKRQVAEELDSPNPIYRSWQTTLWDRLDELFALVDRGSESRGIPREDLYVPAYNGGLFTSDPDAGETAAFLDSHAVGDTYLARVVELLTRRESERGEGRAFVDYSSLDVRHLGSIYEGLLEYDLELADRPLAAVREDGEQEWVPAEDAPEESTVERVDSGEVYLTTETGKRKKTGSYYTPEFVVEYVVERTLDPLMDEIRADLNPTDPDYPERFAERVFDLSVLDPAMGSGHFLVKTVEHLARAVVEAHQEYVERAGDAAKAEAVGDPPDVHWARRQVAQQCIYGADKNGMAVELAKVSLWLRTLAAEQPLAFLDHHLVRGDSLAGTDVAEVEEMARDTGPNASLAEFGATRADAGGLDTLVHRASDRSVPGDAIDDLIAAYREFVAIENESLADVKEMERRYTEIRRDDLRQRLTAMANVHAAERFGLDVPSGAYERMGRALDDAEAWADLADQSWFAETQRIADERDFLHWKLSFPEVFYDDEGWPLPESEAGFDAVVGNPPYVRSQNLPDDLKEYYRAEFDTAKGAYDLYVPFAELAGDLGRRVSLVVPNKWTTTDYGRALRDRLLDDHGLREVLDASNLDVFPDADIYPVVVTYGESPSHSNGDDGNDDGSDRNSQTPDEEIRIRHPGEDRDLSAARTTAVPRSLVDRLGGRVIPLDVVPAFADLAGDVLADCDRLGDHVTMTEGVHTGNVREKLLVEDADTDASDARPKIAGGASVGRYRLDWDGTRIRYDESLVGRGEYADFRTSDCFEGEKLLVRDISDRPVAVHDDADLYALNTLYSVQSRDESDLALRYLLGVFNSEFVATYYRQVYGGTHVSGDYLRFKPMFAEQIPVPDPEDAPVGGDDVAEIVAEYGVEDALADSPSDPERAIATLTERVREARDERAALNCDVLDYLGERGGAKETGTATKTRTDPATAAEPTLGERSVPAAGVGDSILAETSADREGLRVGAVRVREDDTGALELAATARYKPANGEREDRETDCWGYVETDPVAAMVVSNADATERTLVEAFVPAAVERGGGFAGFREQATKTNSLLDRLRALTLPDPERVADDVARYREVRARAAELDERIAALEEAIDEVVYRLYGVDGEQVERTA